MAIKTKKGFKCLYCGTIYDSPAKADLCRDNHDLIYVPFSPEDLNKLFNYVMMPDMMVLKDTQIIKILQKYLRVAYEKKRTKAQKDLSNM